MRLPGTDMKKHSLDNKTHLCMHSQGLITPQKVTQEKNSAKYEGAFCWEPMPAPHILSVPRRSWELSLPKLLKFSTITNTEPSPAALGPGKQV